jgi:nucleotide-binding universal stress UspA family protein
MYKNILIATDGSEFARRAIDQGLELAKALNAHVTAVKVTEPWVEVLSGEAVLVHPEEEYQAEMTTRAAHALGVVAERAATLGSHGRRGLQRLMFGSQTHRVLTNTTLPVLVCR